MLEFSWPLVFLLLPLPWLMLRFAPRIEQQDAALHVPFLARLGQQGAARSGARAPQRLLQALLIITWLALLSAAAGPRWIGDAISMPTSGRDLLLAVDISGSMQMEDMELDGRVINRLELVKAVVGEFVKRRQGDRLGLILYGSQAYLQAPLTFDLNTVNILLQESEIGFAGRETAIGNAIGLAVKRLRKRPESSRVLILMTDGQNTAGEISPQEATRLAQQEHIRIYTIGIGADEILRRTLFGTRRFNPSQELDESSLQDIAAQTGGQYFRARNPKEMAGIYQSIDALEPIEQDAEFYRPIRALFYWPLGLALLCSLLLGLASLPWQRWLKSGTRQQRLQPDAQAAAELQR